MIVTVTPNPSIDRTLRIPPLVRGELLRARSVTAEAGGKGINVSRALAAQGHATLAVVPLSEASAGLIVGLLGGTTPLEAVPTAGEIRVNVSLVEADGTVTKVNEPGPPIRPEDVEALIDRTADLAVRATWVVGCGSLPPGAPADFYARLARRVPAPTRVAIDADGAALRACVGEPIALLKPNRGELEELAGAPLATLGAVVGFAFELVERGAAAVLVSLGPDGAVYVDADGATHAEADIDGVLNPVGAGDALLAGFLAGGGHRAALASGVAWSVAACRSPGTRMRAVTEADAATVTLRPAIQPERQLAA